MRFCVLFFRTYGLSSMTTLTINEIFHSIQGESTHAGRPCVFVRLAFCSLRCTWCDTTYAFDEGERMPVDVIIERVRSYGCPLVEITGGEPLAQPEVHGLMQRLCDEGFEVLLETGGSIDIAPVDARVKRIVDLKCPGSGMEHRNLLTNIAHLRSDDEVKFVVSDRADFDWAAAMIHTHKLECRCTVLMSPVFGRLEPVDLAGWILTSGLPVRMQLQLHKHIWEPATRGV
jgi:7-carboxy-7-deazaguanine synthase